MATLATLANLLSLHLTDSSAEGEVLSEVTEMTILGWDL
jgi:hypothetical protein